MSEASASSYNSNYRGHVCDMDWQKVLRLQTLEACKYCSGPFLQCWARLPPAVLGPSILSKGVEIGPTATHFGQAYA